MTFVVVMRLDGFQGKTLNPGDRVEASPEEAKLFVAALHGGDVFVPCAASLVPVGKVNELLDDDEETDFSSMTIDAIKRHAADFYNLDLTAFQPASALRQLKQAHNDKWSGRRAHNFDRTSRGFKELPPSKFYPGTAEYRPDWDRPVT